MFSKLLTAIFAIATATSLSAATLIVDGSGQLTGATDVDVSGTLYDVTFVDGTCIALFSGCDDPSDFANVDSTAAAQALFDQVLIDGPLGFFGSQPARTLGCAFATFCEVFIPVGPIGFGDLIVTAAVNRQAVDSISTFIVFGGTSSDTATNAVNVFARFDLPATAPVPLPAAGWALLAALGGLVTLRRKAN